MGRNFFKYILLFVLFQCVAITASAESTKQIDIPIDKDYKACIFKLEMEEEGEYTAEIQNSDGQSYTCTQVKNNLLQATINNVYAGKWKVIVTSSAEEIGKVKVSVSATEPVKDNISTPIVVGKDITGFTYYLKNDFLVTQWDSFTFGSVNVKVVDLDTSKVLCDTKVSENSHVCQIPSGIKTISLSVVPSTSISIEGAEKLYTIPIDNYPNGTVVFKDSKYINTDELEVEVILEQPYKVYAEVNEEPVIEPVSYEAGTHKVIIPIPASETNHVSVFLIDEKGNMRSSDHTYIKDTNAPEVTLKNEYDQMVTKEKNITIEGEVHNYSTFTINNESVTPASDGTFIYECDLHDGENNIRIEAKDEADNLTSYDLRITKTVTRKNNTPFIKIVLIAIAFVLFLFSIHKTLKTGSNRVPGKKANRKSSKRPKQLHHNQKQKANEQNNSVPPEEIEETWIFSNSSSSKKSSSKLFKTISNNIGYIIVFASVLLLFHMVLGINYIPSESMAPYILPNDIVITQRFSFFKNTPERGDVVVFSDNTGVTYCKRIIGLPGEKIDFQNGYIYIDGKRIEEQYIDDTVESNAVGTYEVPDNQYFVLGDNRDNSNDSRFWLEPYIAQEKLIGKVFFVVPFHNITALTKK